MNVGAIIDRTSGSASRIRPNQCEYITSMCRAINDRPYGVTCRWCDKLQFSSHVSPLRQCFEGHFLSLPGEGDLAGKQHRRSGRVPGTVFVVAHQGIAAGRKLDPDLVAAAGVEPDADEACLACAQPHKFQPGFFHAAPLPFHNEDLILLRVLPQKVRPVALFRGRAVDHGNVLFDHGALLNRLGQRCGGLFCPGIDHDAAYVFVQPVDGEGFTAQLFLQRGGNIVFGVKSHGFDADRNAAVRIKNFHFMAPPGSF